jgi:hypothetical protein
MSGLEQVVEYVINLALIFFTYKICDQSKRYESVGRPKGNFFCLFDRQLITAVKSEA